jgi:small subunit ribosomal protein S20
MANKKAALKDIRQNKKRAVRNAHVKANVFGLLRRSRRAATTASPDAPELAKQTRKALDKAVMTGIIKRNTAGRLKSRLAKKIA